MNDFVLIGQFPSVQHMSAIGDHFIHIHIALGPTPGLPYDEGKFLVEQVVQDFIANPSDQIGFFFGKDPCIQVGQGRCFFQVSKCLNDLHRHFIDILCDLEILDAALCLSSEIGIGGNSHFTHRIFFYAVIHINILGKINATGTKGG